jgi:hypothetical protein
LTVLSGGTSVCSVGAVSTAGSSAP